MMSIIALDRMKETRDAAEAAFMYWHLIHKPSWFKVNVPGNRIPVDTVNYLREFDKSEFFKGFVHAWPTINGSI
jgi:hypothetical protein